MKKPVNVKRQQFHWGHTKDLNNAEVSTSSTEGTKQLICGIQTNMQDLGYQIKPERVSETNMFWDAG